jgi:hypothetical protein
MRILYLSSSYEGSVHDKKICDEEPMSFPKGITLHQDLGFLGHAPEKVTVVQPTKKPKGKELTDQQKQDNRSKAAFRVIIEHAIGRVKICRIVKDKLRCWKYELKDMLMEICCALHNFRLSIS